MAQALIGPITEIAPELAMHKVGRRVLLYLLTPRSKRFFMAQSQQLQEDTIVLSSKTSKKDKEVRRKELRIAISPALLELVANQGEELLRDSGASLLVTEIMLNAEGGEWLYYARTIFMPITSPDRA